MMQAAEVHQFTIVDRLNCGAVQALHLHDNFTM